VNRNKKKPIKNQNPAMTGHKGKGNKMTAEKKILKLKAIERAAGKALASILFVGCAILATLAFIDCLCKFSW